MLTDTFQMFENEGYFMEKIFPENNQRVINQKSRDITVIIGNPPYSAKQKSENDSNQNIRYDKLDEAIRNSYAEYSTATNKNSLYDSYIRGFKWASERIKNKGIVCFVVNGSFIDNNAMDGFRKCLFNEFTNIYCFNLRGNQRTSGETSRKEGGKIFGSGSRATIAIIILIKNSDHKPSNQVFYYDIGDYLTREQKLSIIQNFGDISAIQWETLTPNDNYDWINQRNDTFESFISLGDKKDTSSKTIFDIYSRGIGTNRDAWAYNFSNQQLTANMSRMIDFYNQQAEQFKAYIEGLTLNNNVEERNKKAEDFIDNNPQNIKWSNNLKKDLLKGVTHTFDKQSTVVGVYRPFHKQWVYFNKNFLSDGLLMPKIFPSQDFENLAIYVTGIGETIKDFSALIIDVIPNLQLHSVGQCFPLYIYEKQKTQQSNNNSEQLSLSLDTNNQQTNSENTNNQQT
ncbi:MAG TPA: type ISP restriction/modification enzyme, partial [Allocoleopsis sp.]